MSRYLLACDAGGTMTDVIIVDEEGKFVIGKAPTTPHDESVGFMESFDEALTYWDMAGNGKEVCENAETAIYTGTGMINTLINLSGLKTGLIVTRGFEDIIVQGRGSQTFIGYEWSEISHMQYRKHREPLVPRSLTRGVTERIDMFGQPVIPMYEHEVENGVRELLAEEHGFEDILTSRVQRQAWSLMEAGKLDEAIPLFENAHETYARLHVHHVAAGVLRGAGFNLLEAGRLDQGYEFAQRSFEYAAGVNLAFGAQLALMDMIGVTFARDEFERCEELLASSPGDSDFRGDLYRMWMAEARGDMDGALRLMVDPDRGGKAPTAVGQIHAAAAGLLFRAGKEDAAKQALQAWVAVERPGDDRPYWIEAAPVTDCLVALGDEELVRRVHQAFLAREERTGAPARFSTLQGRALAPVRAAICLRLGLLDDAERHYREGLAWCEQERLPRDAELCRAGLADVAARR